jgi:FeS assembly SUF system protein
MSEELERGLPGSSLPGPETEPPSPAESAPPAAAAPAGSAPTPDPPLHEAAAAAPAPSAAAEEIRRRVIEMAQTVFDPEIPVNIYDLGLVYSVDVDAAGVVTIQMTLTSPSCPSAEMLPPLVESRARSVPGVTDVRLELVWDPPWNPSMMSEVAKIQLNMF